MYEGRRKILGKFLVDVSKYSTTVILGIWLLKSENVPPILLWRGLGLATLLLALGLFIYPKGKE